MADVASAGQSEGTDSFVMTRRWFHDNSTPGGGWTAKQLRVIGVDWPPRKGWLSSRVGKPISMEQKAEFEALYLERQHWLREHPEERQRSRLPRGQRGSERRATVDVLIRVHL